jgi:hypothetical protein
MLPFDRAQGAVQHDIPFFYYRIIKTILNNHKQRNKGD